MPKNYKVPTPSSITINGRKPDYTGIVRVQDIARQISEGKSGPTILNGIIEKYNVSEQRARQYYQAACRFLMPEDEEEFKKELWAKNISRLEAIIEKGMAKEDFRIAKEAIDSLNKMMGIGGQVKVGGRINPEDGSSEFIVELG